MCGYESRGGSGARRVRYEGGARESESERGIGEIDSDCADIN